MSSVPGASLAIKITGDWTEFDAQAKSREARGVVVQARGSGVGASATSTDPDVRASAAADGLNRAWAQATATGANPTDPAFRRTAQAQVNANSLGGDTGISSFEPYRGLPPGAPGIPGFPSAGNGGWGGFGNSGLRSIIGYYAPIGIGLRTVSQLLEAGQQGALRSISAGGDPLAQAIAGQQNANAYYNAVPFIGGGIGAIAQALQGNPLIQFSGIQAGSASAASSGELLASARQGTFESGIRARQAGAIGSDAQRLTGIQSQLDTSIRDIGQHREADIQKASQLHQDALNALRGQGLLDHNEMLNGRIIARADPRYAAENQAYRARSRSIAGQYDQQAADAQAVAAGDRAQYQNEKTAERVSLSSDIQAQRLIQDNDPLQSRLQSIRGAALAQVLANPANPNNPAILKLSEETQRAVLAESARSSASAIYSGGLQLTGQAVSASASGAAALAGAQLDPLGAAQIQRNAAIAQIALRRAEYLRPGQTPEEAAISRTQLAQFDSQVMPALIQSANDQAQASSAVTVRGYLTNAHALKAEGDAELQEAAGDPLAALHTRAANERYLIELNRPTGNDYGQTAAALLRSRITENIQARTIQGENAIALQAYQNRSDTTQLASSGLGWQARAYDIVAQANEQAAQLALPGVTDSVQKTALVRTQEGYQLAALRREAQQSLFGGTGRATYDPYSIGPGFGPSGNLLNQQPSGFLNAFGSVLDKMISTLKSFAGNAGNAGLGGGGG